MIAVAPPAGPSHGMTVDEGDSSPHGGGAPTYGGQGGGIGFEFALRPEQSPASAGTFVEADIDRLIEHLHRHSHDPDAVRRASVAIESAVETSLWRSARRSGSRLPMLHAELLGHATALFIGGRLKSLGKGVHQWLVILSSPQRIWSAVRAAWNGDDVADQVRADAEWHSVDEIAVFQRHIRTPLVRVGKGVPADEDDWSASLPLFAVTQRYLAGTGPFDDSRFHPACDMADEDQPVQSFVVVGAKSEIAAQVTGFPPLGFKEEMQSLCVAVDSVLEASDSGRAERVARIRQIVMPALKTSGPGMASRFWKPVVVVAAALVAAALLFAIAAVQHLRWEGVVSQLQAEPGIEVLAHSAAWGHRKAHILRDPLARPVGPLMREMGVNPGSVSITEHAFLSADPSITAVRQSLQPAASPGTGVATTARRPADSDGKPALSEQISQQVLRDVRLDLLRSTLALPPDLEMALSGGELIARGALAEPAYTGLATAPTKLAWLKKTDLSEVRDVTAENISELQESLEKTHVEFVPASTILPEASKLRLESIASELRLLVDEAKQKRTSVLVRFCAAHPLVEASSAAMRAEIIRRELIRLGTPEARFDQSSMLFEASGPNVVSLQINLQPSSPAP